MDNTIQRLTESQNSLLAATDGNLRKKTIGMVVAKSRLLYPHLASLSRAEIEAIVATWTEILEDVPTDLLNELYISASKRRRSGFPLSANDILEAFDLHLQQEAERTRRAEEEAQKKRDIELYKVAIELAEHNRELKNLQNATCECISGDGQRYRAQTQVYKYGPGHWTAWMECPKIIRNQGCGCRLNVPLGAVYPESELDATAQREKKISV